LRILVGYDAAAPALAPPDELPAEEPALPELPELEVVLDELDDAAAVFDPLSEDEPLVDSAGAALVSDEPFALSAVAAERESLR
jgi:hypothetical protein